MRPCTSRWTAARTSSSRQPRAQSASTWSSRVGSATRAALRRPESCHRWCTPTTHTFGTHSRFSQRTRPPIVEPDRRLLSPLSTANLRTCSQATRTDTPMTNLTETPDVSRIEALFTQGMHRIGDHEGPFSLHVLGLGKTGANVIESMLTAHRSGGVAADTETPFHALAIDIGGDELTPIQEAAAATTSDRVRAQTVSLPDLERRGG